MTPPADDDQESPPLSDAELDSIEGILQSAPPTAPSQAPAAGPSFVARLTNPPDTWKNIQDALDDMSVPPEIAEQIQSHLNEIGFKVEKSALLPDPFDLKKVRRYTSATRGDCKLALLHLPNWFLRMPLTVGNLQLAVKTISKAHIRIISELLDATPGGYAVALRSMSSPELVWDFVPWEHIRNVLDGGMKIEHALILPAAPAAPVAPAQPIAPSKLRIDDSDLNAIVEIFTQETMINANFCQGVVQASDWPQKLKLQMTGGWSGDPAKDAWRLVNFLVVRNRYDPDHEHRGDTYFGRVLLRLLGEVGSPGETFAQIIIKYKLVTKAEDLQRTNAKLRGD